MSKFIYFFFPAHPQGATRDEPLPLIYKTVSMTGGGEGDKEQNTHNNLDKILLFIHRGTTWTIKAGQKKKQIKSPKLIKIKSEYFTVMEQE